MEIRKLDRHETDFMRDYVQEGVEHGETEEQIRARRKELADLFNCSLPQVAGAVAWKKHEGKENLVLEPLELPGQIQEPSASAAPPPPAPAQDQQQKPPIDNPSQTTSVPEPPRDNPENAPETTSPDVRFHPLGGAWADYEHSAVKEQWRRVESDFIDRSIDRDPAARARMRILCTPGIKCHLEVRHLLKLGFTPGNIVAVEREKKAWVDFEKNARTLGLLPIFGDLAEILPRSNAPFDIALIDFVNAGSASNILTLESLPLADRAVVAINVMAKRERTDFQDMMGRLHKSASDAMTRPAGQQSVGEQTMIAGFKDVLPQGGEIELSEYNRRIVEVVQQGFSATESYLAADNDMSWEERDTMLWYMQRYAGTGRPDRWGLPNKMQNLQVHPSDFDDPEEASRFTEERQKRIYATQTFKQFMMFFQTAAIGILSLFEDPRLMKAPVVYDLLNCVALGRRQIVSMEKYRYNSVIGKTPSPFCTSLAVTEVPKKEYRRFHSFVHFALRLAEAKLQRRKNDGRLPLESSLDFSSHSDDMFGGNRLFAVSRGRRLCSISFAEILRHAVDYSDNFLPKYPLSLWENQKQIPWRNLEEMEQQSK